MIKKTRILIIVILLLGIGFVLLFANINTITVSGNQWYTSEQIIDFLFLENSKNNAVIAYIYNRFREKEEIPFVEDYEVIFHNLNEVEIIVYEKSIVGYVSYMSSYMYFDKDGVVVESANEKLLNVPWITGLNFGQIVLYQTLPIDNPKIFENILNLTQILSINEILVDEIFYNQGKDPILQIGEIKVVLGDDREINGKIIELKSILPELNGKKGTLYLDDYDPIEVNVMYTFIPE